MSARGTEFIGTELLEQVKGNYDRRIGQLQAQIDMWQASSIQERHRQWRAESEEAVHQLRNDILNGVATDSQLEGFRIKSAPSPTDFKYSIQHNEAEIERAVRARDKALAFVSSLAADQGVVTLGAADLRRIGYQP